MRRPKILVFDSGLGGLTVFSEILRARPHADFLYCADDAGFPYGPWPEADLVARIVDLLAELIAAESPDMVVIACNTASTLVLPHLRARWPGLPFVGTVPAIKVAAQRTQSRLISVLATPGTVARDYTRNLIADFANGCDATLVGSSNLARLAEDFMHGRRIDDAAVAAEIAPCFNESQGRRTDVIVLACTHYPLLLHNFRSLAPWPVEWIDPAPAIARRVDDLLAQGFGHDAAGQRKPVRRALFTSGRALEPALARTLIRFGLRPEDQPIPVVADED